MADAQTPLTWLLRKRFPGRAWSEWIVCGKADFDAIKAQPLNWGMEYEAVAVVALPDGVPVVDGQPKTSKPCGS